MAGSWAALEQGRELARPGQPGQEWVRRWAAREQVHLARLAARQLRAGAALRRVPRSVRRIRREAQAHAARPGAIGARPTRAAQRAFRVGSGAGQCQPDANGEPVKGAGMHSCTLDSHGRPIFVMWVAGVSAVGLVSAASAQPDLGAPPPMMVGCPNSWASPRATSPQAVRRATRRTRRRHRALSLSQSHLYPGSDRVRRDVRPSPRRCCCPARSRMHRRRGGGDDVVGGEGRCRCPAG